jgi:hypothetical protein
MGTKKKLTRKQAEEILAKKFNHEEYNGDSPVRPLCISMPYELKNKWLKYWAEVAPRNLAFMSGYCNDRYEVNFLRLLTAHLFIKHVYGEE